MPNYNLILETPETTVVSEYHSQKERPTSYQSEAELEKEFINLLQNQGYEYLNIRTELDLVNNLRTQLEKLNDYKFDDAEWVIFFDKCIKNENDGIVEKTRKIQDDYIQTLKCKDGSTRNIYLIDKKNIHNNSLQVINQYEENGGTYKNRYDVTILVNGLPLVHVELKRRGIPIKEAFNQINRYQQNSFWASSGLYEYVQLFVISNGTNTKYYSNTTRNNYIKEQIEGKRRVKKSSNSFEFTSFWADANNKTIPDLVDFTKTFFSKHTLLNILTKYCVFTVENELLVMRPYQIVAAERILNRIEISNNNKSMGTIKAGGYIWHTTGSGKTLTSFKTAMLATELNYIDKVLFVVDRKDLDYQTMKEYNKFEEGAANSNSNTKVLQKQLEDTTSRIIVTTIQKLNKFIKNNPSHSVYKKHLVIIFDECHRSQFGDMHKSIVSNFKNYHLFGFTGTPIFSKNSTNKSNPTFSTTEQAFGYKLHTYTIVDAINDANVLPFKIDYVNTVKQKDNTKDKDVEAINTEQALNSNERIKNVVDYILEHFDQKTKRNSHYTTNGKRLNGFNSIFAVSSVDTAKKYYLEFKKQCAENQKDLTVSTIYSYTENSDEYSEDGILADESFDTEALDRSSKDFLSDVISEYNKRFKTNYSLDGDGFSRYYKDISERVKNREIDILIVVNMFLTGFDAKTLNTLWVDKNLKMHGLLQAFSRTNRILNSVKTYGNIVCFRNLQKETDDAIALFGDKEASGIVLLKSYKDYYNGYKDNSGKVHIGYKDLISTLTQKFPLGEEIIGEQNKKEFITLMGNMLRMRNILSSFDEFNGNEILSERDFQDYIGTYTDIYDNLKRESKEKESITDDLVFEMELVKSIEVNIDYILMLVAKYHKSNCKDKEILVMVEKAVKSSPALRSKKELIDDFIEKINGEKGDIDVVENWREFVDKKKEEDLEELIKDNKLNEEETRRFMNLSFKNGEVKTIGTDIVKILPRFSYFDKKSKEKKQGIVDRVLSFFEKYFGI